MSNELTTLEPKLTLKQKKFLKLYFETGNGVKSAMQAYDTDDYSTAGAIASENLKKLKSPIKTYLESKGLDLHALTCVLGGGLKADKWNDFTGEREADHNTRHKFLTTAAKWLDIEKDTTEQDPNLKSKLTIEQFFTNEDKK